MKKHEKIHIGYTVGRWTVIGDCIQRTRERSWLCRCACGSERYVLERSLIYGNSLSCGCLRRDKANESAEDLKGRQFGHLTAEVYIPARDKRSFSKWRCRCSCGKIVDIRTPMLIMGQAAHCGCRSKAQELSYRDISGMRFDRLTAMYPLDSHDARGSKLWHCRCDCGTELDVPYNTLLYCNTKSCGCKKREHDMVLNESLARVAGTSINHLQSKKLPANNTSGVKGVLKSRGKYVARIVFQKKQYWLGAYDTLEEAADVRKEAEEVVNNQVSVYYSKWKARAEADPAWAAANPCALPLPRMDRACRYTYCRI